MERGGGGGGVGNKKIVSDIRFDRKEEKKRRDAALQARSNNKVRNFFLPFPKNFDCRVFCSFSLPPSVRGSFVSFFSETCQHPPNKKNRDYNNIRLVFPAHDFPQPRKRKRQRVKLTLCSRTCKFPTRQEEIYYQRKTAVDEIASAEE